MGDLSKIMAATSLKWLPKVQKITQSGHTAGDEKLLWYSFSRTCSFSTSLMINTRGSGGGSVGRDVASNTRGPRFESSHRQNFILNIYCQLYWKDKNKEKEAGNGPFSKTINTSSYYGIIQLLLGLGGNCTKVNDKKVSKGKWLWLSW